MTGLSQHPLQKSIYQLLTGNAPLLSLVQGIYDRPTQGAPFPYITFSGWESEDWSSMTTAGMAVSLALEVWSRAGGHKEAALIMQRLHALLHEANLAVEGMQLVSLRYSGSSIALESDGSTYRGVMRFRALLESID